MADGDDLVTRFNAHRLQRQGQCIGAGRNTHAVVGSNICGKLRLQTTRLFPQNIPSPNQHAFNGGINLFTEYVILASQIHGWD